MREKAHRTKWLLHLIVGPLTLSYEVLALSGDSDQLLVVYTAEPGSESETALRLLAAVTSETIGDAPLQRP